MSPKYIVKKSVDTILTDIEGTTTSISFVKVHIFILIKFNFYSNGLKRMYSFHI